MSSALLIKVERKHHLHSDAPMNLQYFRSFSSWNLLLKY